MERSYPCGGSGGTVGSRRDSFQVVPARAEGTVEDGDWDRSDLLQLGKAARERRVEFRNEIGIPLGGVGSEERGVVGPVVEDRCGSCEHAILHFELSGMSAAIKDRYRYPIDRIAGARIAAEPIVVTFGCRRRGSPGLRDP